MSFLSPVFLWALPLVAVPVLIHFFARRKRETIRWGAMEFLFASAIPQRRFLRLRDWLLLLLRILIVLFIVGALAQPMMSARRFGSSGPRDVILILDNSMSTGRKIPGSTVFEQELNEAARYLGQLNSADLIRVLLTSPGPEWLNDSALPADKHNVTEMMARLRGLAPTEGAADLLDTFQEAVHAEPAGPDTPKCVTLVTDGQARGWRSDEPGGWSALRSLAQKATPPVFASVIVAGQSTRAVANLAIEKISAARPVAGVGQTVTLTVSVKNTGTSPSEAGSVAWTAGDQSLGATTVPALQPGVGTTLSLIQSFAAPGLMDIQCRLAAEDDLPADNSAHFLLDVSRATPILLVEGESQSDPIQSNTHYFLAALGYGNESNAPASTSIFQPKVVDYEHLNAEDFSTFQCIVLADVPRLPPEQVKRLARFVGTGGGLWIALGPQTDPDAFNRVFFEQSAGLSPLALRQPIGDAEDREKFVAVVPPSVEHPATALLADIQRLDIDRVRIQRRHQFNSADSSAAAVLLRVEGGAPLVVEKTLGRGRIIVQAIPLGLAWSNLALCHSYVVMVHEWLWYLTEPGLVKRNLQQGEPLQASLALAGSNGHGSLETPAGRRAQLIGEEEGGRMVFRYSKTTLPGEYRLSIPAPAQTSRFEKFFVARDSAESDLTPLSEQQIKLLSETGGLVFGTGALPQSSSRQIAAPSKGLAEVLLLALVLLMASEAVIAFWLARHRRMKSPAVVMEPGVQS